VLSPVDTVVLAVGITAAGKPMRVSGSVDGALASIAARFSDEPPRVEVLQAALRKRYAALEAWPSDAMLGLLTLGWVLGPGFALAAFREAVNRLEPDFALAGSVSFAEMAPKGPSFLLLAGIVRTCFTNAGIVVDRSLPDVLYWPLDLAAAQAAERVRS
jgi:hypothetical protein